MLDKFAGKGQLLPNGKKERVDFGKPIGKYYDRDTGEYIETTRGMIHYVLKDHIPCISSSYYFFNGSEGTICAPSFP